MHPAPSAVDEGVIWATLCRCHDALPASLLHAHAERDSSSCSRFWIAVAIRQGIPTVPGPLGQELATNPFLRTDDVDIRMTLGLPEDASDVATFTAVRKAKDLF